MKYFLEAFKYKQGMGSFVLMMIGIVFTIVISTFWKTNLAVTLSFVGGIISVIGGQEFCKVMVALQNGMVPKDEGEE